jgi:type IV pilus assembly protein PilE
MELAQRQQAFMLDARRYASTLAELGNPTAPERVANFYEEIDIDVDADDARPNFTLTAQPKEGTTQEKDSAGAMTINHAGVKTPANYW